MVGSSRKRARPTDDDDDGVEGDAAAAATTSLAATPSKRRRLPNGAMIETRTKTTPKTPRTVHTVASAISGALAYGVGMVKGGSGAGGGGNQRTGRSRFALPSFAARERDDGLSKDALDKLYDVPDEEEEEEKEEENKDSNADDTLVGSPTPDTPSRPPNKMQGDGHDNDNDDHLRTPTAGRKRRDPLSNLAIDGTDRLGALDMSLSRSARARHTPQKYREDDTVRPAASGRGGGGGGGRRARGGSAAGRSARSARASQTNTPTKKTPRRKPTTEAAGGVEGGDAVEAVVSPKKRGGAAASASAKKSQASKEKTPWRGKKGKTTTVEAAQTSSQKAQMQKEVDQAEAEDDDDDGVDDDVDDDDNDNDNDDDDDDEVCALCGRPDSAPPNEILFCDNCDLAVHQQCYHVPVIPEGDWLCKNCAQDPGGLVPRTTTEAGTAEEEPSKREPTPAGAGAGAGAGQGQPPPRSLAPDIVNFETHLRATQRILLDRCTGRRRLGRPRRRRQEPTPAQDDLYEKAYDKAFQLVEQTVVAGEGNSMMVIGARGSGKTALVESVLEELAAKQAQAAAAADDDGSASWPAFHVVRLSGFIHTDDKLALREIWRQLGKEMAVEDEIVSKTNNYADTMASLLALLSHPTEIGEGQQQEEQQQQDNDTAGHAGSTAVPGVTSTAVVFVLDEFDLFATHARQTLLYNLFDIAQARKAPIAVLGLTTRVDVVESLEKRVKSRFSHRSVYLSLPKSLPAYWATCRRGLVLDDDDDEEGGKATPPGQAAFRQWWNHMVDTLGADPACRAQLAFHYYSSKSVAAFWTACVPPLAQLTPAAPRLQMGPPLGMSTAPRLQMGRPLGMMSTAPPDAKSHLLAALSELELALLIAAARLDVVLSTDTVNFAMAYDEYVSLMGRQRVQQSTAASGLNTLHIHGLPGLPGLHGLHGNTSHTTILGGSARVWGRGVAARAWERLASLGLLLPAGLGGGGGGGGGGRAAAAPSTGGLEGRSMWRTEVVLEEIPAAVKLGAVMARWCKEI